MDDTDRAEVARLRDAVTELGDAVDNLATRIGADPAHAQPSRAVHCNGETHLMAEWDVVFHPNIRGLRQLAVRAGWPDGMPAVLLVDEVGDMFYMGRSDAQRLIEALTAAVAHSGDQVARQRALITSKDKP